MVTTKQVLLNYTIIELSLIYASSGSTAHQAYIQNLVEQYEALLVDDVHYVRIKIDHREVEHPKQYYDYAMPAAADLVVGGIQGSLLDAPGFLEIFNADNRGGFTLNWGIDTSTANIKVEYVNLDGVEVKEYWSFDAIVEALSRKTYVKEGREQKDWSNPDDLINAYQDMENDLVESISEGSQDLAEILLGKTFAEIIEEEGYAEVIAKVAKTESGKDILYVVGKEGNNWVLVDKFALITDVTQAVESAFNQMAGVSGLKVTDLELLDSDEKLVANEYIAAKYEKFTTLEKVAEEFGLDLAELRVYGSTYVYDGTTYVDAVVVRQIGDFFVVVEWL